MKLEYYEIIKKPAFSEKSTYLQGHNKYVFYIHDKANKKMVAEAVKKLFNVTPVAININRLPRKKKKKERFAEGHTAFKKKAIVTVKSGEKIAEMKVE